MTRAVAALLLLLAACTRPPSEVDAGAGIEEPEKIPFQRRFVRVHLRSFGDWKTLTITAKGGLHVGAETVERFVLRRDEPRMLNLRGEKGIIRVNDRAYAGDIFWRHQELIQNVSLENYVLGVLRGELPLKKVPVAAAGAQAIAVRSYTLHYVKQHHPVFDVDDTTLFQVYAGLKYAPDDDALRAGVQATTGLYLAYEGEPLKAYYHSTCGGHTTDIPTGLEREAQAPMSGVPCDFCKASKYWRWTAQLTDTEILAAARVKGPLRNLSVEKRGPGGRASVMRVDAAATSLRPAGAFRLAAGPSKLRSTNISRLERVRGGYRVHGAGWGHGVGLCQMGAIGRALADPKKWTAESIVRVYYPGADLVSIP